MQHQALINRVEQSLNLVQQCIATESPSTLLSKPTHTLDSLSEPMSSTMQGRPNKVGPIATRIMQAWYDHNTEHPYPSYEAAEVLANAGHINVEQVKKWFANRRQRLGKTKKISEIVRRRKRVRTLSGGHILLDDAKMARFQ